MKNHLFNCMRGDSPVIAVALHNGHDVRAEVGKRLSIDDATRLREEDPFTGQWTAAARNRIIVLKSRFEVDLNRAREQAVYVEPGDAWGLSVWQSKPDQEFIGRSLAEYDHFYAEIKKIFEDMRNRYGKFIVLDIHAYNHRRSGPDSGPADPSLNPEVNVGTKTMHDRKRWAPVVDRFIRDLSDFNYLGRHLDVRENVKFYGRQLAQWTHDHFTESACVLSIEFKKFFMDEWTGKADTKQIQSVLGALVSVVPGLIKELKNIS